MSDENKQDGGFVSGKIALFMGLLNKNNSGTLKPAEPSKPAAVVAKERESGNTSIEKTPPPAASAAPRTSGPESNKDVIDQEQATTNPRTSVPASPVPVPVPSVGEAPAPVLQVQPRSSSVGSGSGIGSGGDSGSGTTAPAPAPAPAPAANHAPAPAANLAPAVPATGAVEGEVLPAPVSRRAAMTERSRLVLPERPEGSRRSSEVLIETLTRKLEETKAANEELLAMVKGAGRGEQAFAEREKEWQAERARDAARISSLEAALELERTARSGEEGKETVIALITQQRNELLDEVSLLQVASRKHEAAAFDAQTAARRLEARLEAESAQAKWSAMRIAELEGALEEVAELRSSSDETIAEMERRYTSLSEELLLAESRANAAEERLAAMETDTRVMLEGLNERCMETAAALAAARASRDEVLAEVTRLNGECQKHESHIKTLKACVEKATSKDNLSSDLAASRAEALALRAELSAAAEAAQKATAEAAEGAAERASALEKRCEELESALAQLQHEKRDRQRKEEEEEEEKEKEKAKEKEEDSSVITAEEAAGLLEELAAEQRARAAAEEASARLQEELELLKKSVAVERSKNALDMVKGSILDKVFVGGAGNKENSANSPAPAKKPVIKAKKLLAAPTKLAGDDDEDFSDEEVKNKKKHTGANGAGTAIPVLPKFR
jgi:hypothetical protein